MGFGSETGGLAPGFSVSMVGADGVPPKDLHFGLKEGVARFNEGGVEVGAFVKAGEGKATKSA